MATLEHPRAHWLPEVLEAYQKYYSPYAISRLWPRKWSARTLSQVSHAFSLKGVSSNSLRYRIDAITIFAVPATGPHGFYTIGKRAYFINVRISRLTCLIRTIESTLRTMNNLLERLHASFFFYIMTSETTFHKIGHYLPAVIMLSVATMFSALGTWVDAAWRVEPDEKYVRWIQQKRPILEPLSVMLVTHILGLSAFYLFSEGWITPESYPPGLSIDFIKRLVSRFIN